MMGFAAALSALVLLGFLNVWGEGKGARHTNRLRRRAWPETQRLRAADRVAGLERDLDMGPYDEISAIIHIQRQLPPPKGSYYEAQGRPRREEVPHETLAERRQAATDRLMEDARRRRFRPHPNLQPEPTVVDYWMPAIGLDPIERELLEAAGPPRHGCDCRICQTLARHLAWHEHLERPRRDA
jgi:hypothetical protein